MCWAATFKFIGKLTHSPTINIPQGGIPAARIPAHTRLRTRAGQFQLLQHTDDAPWPCDICWCLAQCHPPATLPPHRRSLQEIRSTGLQAPGPSRHAAVASLQRCCPPGVECCTGPHTPSVDRAVSRRWCLCGGRVTCALDKCYFCRMQEMPTCVCYKVGGWVVGVPHGGPRAAFSCQPWLQCVCVMQSCSCESVCAGGPAIFVPIILPCQPAQPPQRVQWCILCLSFPSQLVLQMLSHFSSPEPVRTLGQPGSSL